MNVHEFLFWSAENFEFVFVGCGSLVFVLAIVLNFLFD